MATFCPWNNRDKADVYTNALLEAGYTIQNDYSADFMLIDYERSKQAEELKKYKKPIFIYPHSTISDILWDGLYNAQKVTMNFAIGEGQRRVMEKYGYQYPICVCGWTYGKILPFSSTSGQRLLFAPVHPNSSGKRLTDLDKNANKEAMTKIMDNSKLFRTITVRYSGELEDNGLAAFKDSKVKFQVSDLRFRSSTDSIASADVVVSFGTFGYLSVSLGRPTIFYGQDVVPHNMVRSVQNYNKYKAFRDYPVDLASNSMRKVVDSVRKSNPKVEEWKKLFIGRQFDKTLFLWMIKQYVK